MSDDDVGGLHSVDCLIWTSEDPADTCDCGGLPDPHDRVDPDQAHDARVSQHLADIDRRAS